MVAEVGRRIWELPELCWASWKLDGTERICGASKPGDETEGSLCSLRGVGFVDRVGSD